MGKCSDHVQLLLPQVSSLENLVLCVKHRLSVGQGLDLVKEQEYKYLLPQHSYNAISPPVSPATGFPIICNMTLNTHRNMPQTLLGCMFYLMQYQSANFTQYQRRRNKEIKIRFFLNSNIFVFVDI